MYIVSFRLFGVDGIGLVLLPGDCGRGSCLALLYLAAFLGNVAGGGEREVRVHSLCPHPKQACHVVYLAWLAALHD